MSGDARLLQAELYELIDQFGEAEVVATLKALTKRRPGRPPEDALRALLCMAFLVGMEWPERISLSGRGRNLTSLEKSVSLAAKKVAPLVPWYHPEHRKDVQKNLRLKLMKALDGRPKYVHELLEKIAVYRQFIKGLQKRWGPFGDSPEGAAILAQLDELYGFPEISGQECAIDLRRYSRCQL
jgi:hypothetical protein